MSESKSRNCCHGVVEWLCGQCKPIHTSKDQLWNFTWPHTGPNGGPPIDIHSKGHFLRECRKRNLKWVGQDDLKRRGDWMKPTQNKHDVKALIKEHGRAIVESAKQKARKEGVTWGS